MLLQRSMYWKLFWNQKRSHSNILLRWPPWAEAIIPASPAIPMCCTCLYLPDEFRVHFEPVTFCFQPSDNLSHCYHLLYPLGFLKSGCRIEWILSLLLKTNSEALFLLQFYHESVCACVFSKRGSDTKNHQSVKNIRNLTPYPRFL